MNQLEEQNLHKSQMLQGLKVRGSLFHHYLNSRMSQPILSLIQEVCYFWVTMWGRLWLSNEDFNEKVRISKDHTFKFYFHSSTLTIQSSQYPFPSSSSFFFSRYFYLNFPPIFFQFFKKKMGHSRLSPNYHYPLKFSKAISVWGMIF